LTEEGVAGSGAAILGEKTSILLGCRGQIWTICQDLTLVREAPYAAIGSGRLRAYGALHALQASGVEPARRRLELALEAPAAYTSNVRPPWHFVSGGSLDRLRLEMYDRCRPKRPTKRGDHYEASDSSPSAGPLGEPGRVARHGRLP
jgi:hypothetical protein